MNNITDITSVAFAGQNYIPWEYEAGIILIGFLCWLLMKYMEDLEVVFGFLAIIIFGIAAYFAAYMAMIENNIIVNTITENVTVVHTQYVTPQPILQIFLIVCFLFAIIIEVYVVFLRQADKKLESSNFVDADGIRKGRKEE